MNAVLLAIPSNTFDLYFLWVGNFAYLSERGM
jgi:hypothetical protein